MNESSSFSLTLNSSLFTSKLNGLYLGLRQKRLLNENKVREEGMQKRAPRQLVRSRRAADEQREQVRERKVEERESANTPQVTNLEDRSTLSEKEDVEEELIGERAGEGMTNVTEQDIAEEKNLVDRIVGGVEQVEEDYVEERAREDTMEDENWDNAEEEGFENREEDVGADWEPVEKWIETANVEQLLVDEEDVEKELVQKQKRANN